jgi:hypothetical protein
MAVIHRRSGSVLVYSAFCNEANEFVFQTSGCLFDACFPPTSSCLSDECSSCGDQDYTTLDPSNELGLCYEVTSTDQVTNIETVRYSYVINGDCSCTNSPTMSPAPTGTPTGRPTRTEAEFEGVGKVACTLEEDECDFREGSRCSNLSWDLIEKEEGADFDRFGSEGIVTFQMEEEDCKAICTKGCSFTASGAQSMVVSVALATGLSALMTLAAVFGS